MKIILAKSAGFCCGVKRAVTLASEAPKSAPAPVQIVGDIVHNEFVIDQLKKAGVKKRKNFDGVRRGSFIIQAHGISSKVLKKIEQRGLNIIDTTCPNVKKVHNLVKQLSKQGYFTEEEQIRLKIKRFARLVTDKLYTEQVLVMLV